MRTYYLTVNEGITAVTVKDRHRAYALPYPMEGRTGDPPNPRWNWGTDAPDPFPLAYSLLADAAPGHDVSAYVEDFARYVIAQGPGDRPRTLTSEVIVAWMTGHSAATASLSAQIDTLLSHLAPKVLWNEQNPKA